VIRITLSDINGILGSSLKLDCASACDVASKGEMMIDVTALFPLWWNDSLAMMDPLGWLLSDGGGGSAGGQVICPGSSRAAGGGGSSWVEIAIAEVVLG
jgi:hypothetical protein